MRSFYTLIFLLISCNPDKLKKVEVEQVDFETSEASELFFRNIRQTYYRKDKQPESNLDIYRLKKLVRQNPKFFPTIVHNWQYDEAYLIMDFDFSLNKENKLILLWNGNQDGKMNSQVYTIKNKESHFQLSTTIYNHILNEDRVLVKQNNDTLRLFENNEEKEGFRITMVDYYRLVDIYK